jgi:hypothetical protein
MGRYTNGLRELSGNGGVRVRLLRSRAGYSRCVGIGRNGDNVFYRVLFVAGLTLMGLVASLRGGLRLLGAVVSISGALGWVSLLTDPAFSGVLVPMRPVHVAFAAAFCLSWVVWGAVLMVPRENR